MLRQLETGDGDSGSSGSGASFTSHVKPAPGSRNDMQDEYAAFQACSFSVLLWLIFLCILMNIFTYICTLSKISFLNNFLIAL